MILTETDKTIKAFEEEIKRLLKAGKTPKEAVNEAYKMYPVMKIMQGEIEPQLIGEMKRGGAVGVAKPLLKKASTAVWAADGLTLSKRTTQGAKEVTKQAAAVIAEAVKKGQTVQKAALALFDGYGYGHTLPEQGIPDFLKQLTHIAKAKDYGGAEFRKTIRAVERNLKKLNVQGLKAAYTQVKNAVLSGNEKRIEKAVYTATQERTRYFARRIARTEMARAYNDGFITKWANDEDCIAFKWKMSTAHPFCDICDMYAEADLYGMGPGIFPKDKVPTLPVHPNCMCHLRPVMVGSKLLKSETPHARIEDGGREWLDKQTLPNRQRILGVYGEKDVKAGRSWTEKARGYNGEKMKSRIEKRGGITDVTKDYIANGVDTKGTIVIDDGCRVNLHSDEVKVAMILKRTIGGNIRIVDERINYPQKSPDYIWDGKSWDLKTISSEKAADSAIRHGLKQIEKMPGGIILYLKNDDIDKHRLLEIIQSRLCRSAEFDIDVILLKKEDVYQVLQYKKK